MAPLILHNVPDDELYVGEDGKQRPYAMLFPHHEGHHAGVRGRRPVAETGSFGRSARRSRSKTATPARREDPTLAAADKMFSNWFEQQRKGNAEDAAAAGGGELTTSQRKSSGGGEETVAGKASATAAEQKKTPVEVILRGFRSQAQQYAAINHYELLAGLICEDYPRDPPAENRRYRSEMRDPAYTRRRRALTPRERELVNNADGGEHWIKVTFESALAADTACAESPQSILGHLVYAEPYHGGPPARDEAIPDRGAAGRAVAAAAAEENDEGGAEVSGGVVRYRSTATRGGSSAVTRATRGLPGGFSPSNSLVSSNTADTGTLGSLADTVTVSSATVTTGIQAAAPAAPSAAEAADAARRGEYCRNVPTVRLARVRPAEEALLPQQSYVQRVVNHIPFLKWFSGSMIGNEVPRTELGDFDWERASLYWKAIWWLDATFRLFGGEIVNSDKDD